MRVFLADDEDLELFGIEKMLSDMPLELEICGTARNGEEGLRRILELCPDVVISDVKMPKLDGVAMTRRLREQGFSGEIVFISGYQDFSCAREAVSLGAREYLLKPVNR
ncbi:MAG: response regulator, partial [Neglectibacter timonensis]